MLDGADWSAVAKAVPLKQSHVESLKNAGFESPGYLRVASQKMLDHLFKNSPNPFVSVMLHSWLKDRCRVSVPEQRSSDDTWISKTNAPSADFFKD